MILRNFSKYHLIKPIKLLDSCSQFLLLVATVVAETKSKKLVANRIFIGIKI